MMMDHVLDDIHQRVHDSAESKQHSRVALNDHHEADDDDDYDVSDRSLQAIPEDPKDDLPLTTTTPQEPLHNLLPLLKTLLKALLFLNYCSVP